MRRDYQTDPFWNPRSRGVCFDYRILFPDPLFVRTRGTPLPRVYYCTTATHPPQYSYKFRCLGSVVHPGCDPVASKSRSKPQAGGAQGEIGHQVPDEGDYLQDGRDEGENGAVKLYHADRPSANTDTRLSISLVWGVEGRECDRVCAGGVKYGRDRGQTYSERGIQRQCNGAKVSSRKGQTSARGEMGHCVESMLAPG